MSRKVIISGFLGGIVLLTWTFIINGLLGMRNRMDMNQITQEQRVYEILVDQINQPGRYILNPMLTSSGTFPDNEPIFSILYSGLDHGDAGKLMLFQLVIYLCSPILGAWFLSSSSQKVLSSYARKVLFFSTIGLLLALYCDLLKFNIDGYPFNNAVILAINNIIAWTLAGLAVAWRLQPGKDLEKSQEISP